ncbi:hypothetical protein WJX73_002806 [Symbiochloris irregularis]|uniref:AB hydrolase-1 domain-containing protein n=1 Tax=Symbiochloris irregularis TaxID=706552 RepID=A0AAW1P786_9CHLO
MHSYGGKVGTPAVQGLSKAARTSNGLPGGIVHLVFLTAAITPEGLSADEFGSIGLPPIRETAEGATELIDPTKYFYHDLPTDQQKYWASKLRPFKGSRIDKGGYAGYLHVPSTYLVCENDRVVQVELQRKIIKAAVQAGA